MIAKLAPDRRKFTTGYQGANGMGTCHIIRQRLSAAGTMTFASSAGGNYLIYFVLGRRRSGSRFENEVHSGLNATTVVTDLMVPTKFILETGVHAP